MLAIATAIVWITAYVAWTADWAFGEAGMVFIFERALRRIPLCLFGAGCCWTMKRLLDRTMGQVIGWRVAVALLLCLLASLSYAGANMLVFYVIAPLWGSQSLAEVLEFATVVSWVFFAWTALYFAIDADWEARSARIRLADAETETLRARNQALAQQISPHFLFNALNTVSGLIIGGEPARAERVTMALAGLLRRSLETDAREYVSLGEEMDAVHRYLEIEENRFEHRLSIAERVPADLRHLEVPPMILQPLVENAVKHGVARSSERVQLTIAAELADGQLRIIIADDAVPDRDAALAVGNGIGNPNVRQRLALLYGDRASLRCYDHARGYSAHILIPVGPHGAA